MTTLRIEHAITDYDTWREAFDRFADVRREAGVSGFTIRRPLDDQLFLMLDLEFETADQARGFAAFLEERVWSDSGASPALTGVARTRILEVVG